MIRLVMRLLARVFGWPYVWVEDNEEHKIYKLRVHQTPFGFTVRHPRTNSRTRLNLDGSMKLGSYVTAKWLPANKAARKLFPGVEVRL